MKQINENGFTIKWTGDDIVFEFFLGICSEYEYCVKAFTPTERTAFRVFTRFTQSEGSKGLFTAKLIADADLVKVNKAIFDRGLFVGESGGHIVLAKENYYTEKDGVLIPVSFGDKTSFRPTVVIFHSKDYTWINQIFDDSEIKVYGSGSGKVSGEEITREVPKLSSIPQAIEVKMEQKEFSVQKSCYEILEFLYGREIKQEESDVKKLSSEEKPSIRARMQFIKDEERRQNEEKMRQREEMMTRMYGGKKGK